MSRPRSALRSSARSPSASVARSPSRVIPMRMRSAWRSRTRPGVRDRPRRRRRSMGADDAGISTVRIDPTTSTQTPRGEHGHATPASTVEHLSRKERQARGKAARKVVPRESQAEFAPEVRLDPIDLLQEQARTRVPELEPIRYGRMSASPFSLLPRRCVDHGGRPLDHTQLRAESPDSAVMLTCRTSGCTARRSGSSCSTSTTSTRRSVGPWEWDVKRFATSVEIAGRDDGFSDKQRRKAVLAGVKEYRKAMRSFADMTNLEACGTPTSTSTRCSRRSRRSYSPSGRRSSTKPSRRRKTRDSMQAFTKLTEEVDGEPRIVSRPPLIVPLDELLKGDERDAVEQGLVAILGSYRKTLEFDRRHLLDGVPVRRDRSQGGRCGERRHAGVDRADARHRRARSVDPAGQRGR